MSGTGRKGVCADHRFSCMWQSIVRPKPSEEAQLIVAIAMSVRSTNVYEERGKEYDTGLALTTALGVYEPEDPTISTETEPAFQGKKHEVFRWELLFKIRNSLICSKYLGWHMRRQLAFDIWPLSLAIFLICIIERDRLMDPGRVAWFTVFRVIFECTSAYATIGLSMGTPNNNYSFAGEFKTLSKLVVSAFLRDRRCSQASICGRVLADCR